MHAQMHIHAQILLPYYYVLYTHPERDQCYNESRQSVPDASSGPGQSIHGCRERAEYHSEHQLEHQKQLCVDY